MDNKTYGCANCECHIEHDVILCNECYEDAKSLRAASGLDY